MRMRCLFPLPSTLACALLASVATAPIAAVAQELETLTVTASRSAHSLGEVPASLSVIDTSALTLVSATHISEALARVPGVWIARGNGQEHLTAIRSPVLTGAGSCGAFAVTEHGIPVRATGFCNVNQLFDVNTEQAERIEVLRGPGTVLFGSDAQHGVINVLSPAPADARATQLGLEAGPNDYARLRVSHSERAGQHGLRVNVNAAHDGGYKHDAGFDQQKLTARHDYQGQSLNTRTLISVNNLNQETAGYVVGTHAYKDRQRKRENPNPEAYRDSQSVRIQTQLEVPMTDGASWLITPYARHTDMTFMMHFLPGTPLEQNGHQSVGVQCAYFAPLSQALDLTAGIDAEATRAWLKQTQTSGFGAFPAGKHYDYRVQALLAAAFTSLDLAVSEATNLNAGLRIETLQYDYDNLMISGNTAEDGGPCVNNFTGAVGCRYTRPDDSRDRFSNASVNLGGLHSLNEHTTVFARWALSHRAPQATELYRLQNGQMHANLKPEAIHSLEFGARGQWATLSYSATAFHMYKTQVILQSADRLNINGGKTEHTGIEYELQWQLSTAWQLGLTGTLADHHYRANVSAPGSADTLATDGNRIVSAPYSQQALRLSWAPTQATHAELEWLALGRYYTDLENSHSYKGHKLLNLRLEHQLSQSVTLGAQLKNLTNADYAERADYSVFGGDRYFIGEPRALFVNAQWQF